MNRRVQRIFKLDYHHLRFVYLLRDGASMSIFYWQKIKMILDKRLWNLFHEESTTLIFSDLESVAQSVVRGLIRHCKIIYQKFRRVGSSGDTILKDVSRYSMRDCDMVQRNQEDRRRVDVIARRSIGMKRREEIRKGLEKMRGTPEEAIAYAKKEESRVASPWEHGVYLKRGSNKRKIRDREWQIHVQRVINEELDN
ncbi:Para-Rep C1 [Camellia lanceoleosa]|uniref:Para-Rep C1 n=1 Tax=Camellia lanceoleosa TaxID=1840588 RepID=A0ACC0ICQ4_9ERIC|nr:Para-Rep C1 [Camellia lanceoleosa]